MTVKQITPNLLQLTIYRLVNCYLVVEPDGFTLVDALLPGHADEILSAAAAGGLPIRRILLTHAHSDHIGSLDVLAGRYGDLEVAISARDARLLAGDRSLDADEPQGKLRGGLPGAATRPGTLLADADRFGSLRAIATPGHTPGHLCFLDERDGSLLAGDALLTVGGRLRVASDAPWYFPLPQLATWDRPLALRSAARLLSVADASPITRIAPGHGSVLEGGAPILADALDHATGTSARR